MSDIPDYFSFNNFRVYGLNVHHQQKLAAPGCTLPDIGLVYNSANYHHCLAAPLQTQRLAATGKRLTNWELDLSTSEMFH